MTFSHFTAGKDDSERRLDRILRRFLNDENLSSLYKSLRKGFIKVNGKKCEGNFRVTEGDDIQIADFLLKPDNAQKNPGVESTRLPLEQITVLKTPSLLFLNKPYDIPVQPSSSSNGNSLSEIVQEEYEKSHKNNSLSFRSGPLHRLDRKTTGIIAFSQDLEGARYFSEVIKNHTVQKFYFAILEGKLTQNQVWKDYINKEDGNKKQGTSSVNTPKNTHFFHTVSVSSESDEYGAENGKFAHTEVFPLSYGFFEKKDITFVRILIKTGRTHQIRSQSQRHGFPLLGDTAYGGTKINSQKYGQDFFLHAGELHLPEDNPLGLPQIIKAPLPEDFMKMLEICATQNLTEDIPV
ncbi:MAG: RluA family pseudouridine synthase [Treponema sp.]|nr:RluA family pseudouridine synthase [Treponema sp.]